MTTTAIVLEAMNCRMLEVVKFGSYDASYTRRNIIADAFRRLGAYPQRLGAR